MGSLKSKIFTIVTAIFMIAFLGCENSLLRTDLYDGKGEVINVGNGVGSVVLPSGNGFESGKIYKLTKDITIDFKSIVIPKDVAVTIDLNGFVIDRFDRGLETCTSVFVNEGTLTIIDSNPNAVHKYKWIKDTPVEYKQHVLHWDEKAGGEGVEGGVNLNGGAIVGGEALHSSARFGGAILNRGKLYLKSGNIVGNISNSGGGGVYVAKGATFVMDGGQILGNRTYQSARGGGVFVDNGGTFIFKGGKIDENYALSGGGIFVNDGAIFEMYGGSVSKNEVHAEFNNGGKGGGIDGESRIIKSEDDFVLGTPRKISVFGGEVRDNISAFHGGGIAIGYSETVLKNVTVSGNRSLGGNGGGIHIDSQLKNVKLENVSVLNNISEASTIYEDSLRSGNGGGIHVRTAIYHDAQLDLVNCTIRGNEAERYGGGLFADVSTAVIMKGGVVESNVAGAVGGGVVFFQENRFMQEGGVIRKNQAQRCGGIYSFLSECDLNGEISENRATDDYGGMLLVGGVAMLRESCNITKNTSEGIIGGVVARPSSGSEAEPAEPAVLYFAGGAVGGNLGYSSNKPNNLVDVVVDASGLLLEKGGFGTLFFTNGGIAQGEGFQSGYFGSNITQTNGDGILPADVQWINNPGDNPLFPVDLFPVKAVRP